MPRACQAWVPAEAGLRILPGLECFLPLQESASHPLLFVLALLLLQIDNLVLSPKPGEIKASQNVTGIGIFTAGLVLVCLANDSFASSGEEADIFPMA